MLLTHMDKPLAARGENAARDDSSVRPSSNEYRVHASAAAEEFEALFIRGMLSQMRKTTRELSGKDSGFSDSINSDMLDFADMAVADQMAKQHLFGIADMVLAQFLPDDTKKGNIHIKNADAVVAPTIQAEREMGIGLAAFATPLRPPNHK